MYYEYQSPFPPFPVMVLGATAMYLAFVLAVIFLGPLLAKLGEWWDEKVDLWWAGREGR